MRGTNLCVVAYVRIVATFERQQFSGAIDLHRDVVVGEGNRQAVFIRYFDDYVGYLVVAPRVASGLPRQTT